MKRIASGARSTVWRALLLGLALASLPACQVTATGAAHVLDAVPQVAGSVPVPDDAMRAERDALDRGFEAYLRGHYRLQERRSVLIARSDALWAAQQLRLDNAARGWGGKRITPEWQRPGHDLYGIWSTSSRNAYVGMAMGKTPVDAEGHHLLTYYEMVAASDG